jgi:outer membrane protein assembly factor BamD
LENRSAGHCGFAIPLALTCRNHAATVRAMNRRLGLLFLVTASVLLFPFRSPAPLIYTPGEGWRYEPVGGGNWVRSTAKEQLLVAQDGFDKKNYSLALRAAKRVVALWPLSDYAPQAQYLIGRCYQQDGLDQKAFKAYQKLVEKYPTSVYYEEVLTRQYEIALKFLAGEWFRVWDLIPLYRSMDKTAELFGKIVKAGPYSSVAPQAQMKIGEAREKQKNYSEAAKAYELAADRYNDRPIAADALFKEGLAYQKQASTAEYDQGTAGQAITVFTDFMTLYPDEPRVPEAQRIIASLKHEQARGNLEIAHFYERRNHLVAARIYYNEVVGLSLGEPDSPYAVAAKSRLAELNAQLQKQSPEK